VLIVNFLGVVFKIAPLGWDEWLVTVAIGAGAMIWSFGIRFISRTFFADSSSGSSSGRGCWAWVTERLTRLNQVTSKQMVAAAAVYDSNKLCGVEMSVQVGVRQAGMSSKRGLVHTG
jgi:hypothetical protein